MNSSTLLNPQICHIFFTVVLLLILVTCLCTEEFCYTDSNCEPPKDKRFLLYDVNPPEGFNLRRDVYMRFAILAHKLKSSKHEKLNNFRLVLPPWSRLYHWGYSPEPEQISWGLYFDLNSLKEFAPVIEMYEFFQMINKTYNVVIDEVYILQHFKDMFESGKFEDKIKIEECAKHEDVNFFFYKNFTAKNVKCLSYHGAATKLTKILSNTPAKTILLHHAEVALHHMFGDKLYWQCRRSMRFNKDLQKIATDFRSEFLNSSDGTILPEKWQDEKPHRNTQGGPYLAIHLRRKDFVRGRPHQVPSLESVAKQIIKSLEKLNLDQVFIATDATEDEYENLVKDIPRKYKVMKYVPSNAVRAKFKDGGVAIIEQIICSHARHFIGTYESTFSFRIQEEREILGFAVETTFNSFCKEKGECPQPSVWKIVH